MSLFTVTAHDREVYENEIRDFLPEQLIDIHTHVYVRPKDKEAEPSSRTVSWPRLVARDNCIEDLIETYQLMFPGKSVTPLMFSTASLGDGLREGNDYLRNVSRDYHFPALYFVRPTETIEEIRQKIIDGHFLGIKGYLNFAPDYLPRDEIRILDFLPKPILQLIDEMGLLVMCHIPRESRLKDSVNIGELKLIAEEFPHLTFIVAHVGRAYCLSDLGDGLKALKDYSNLYFDFSANCNTEVFYQLLSMIPHERILFGSDLPILRMRTKRIEENGTYINLIPQGLYGDPSKDRHLREVSEKEAEAITFFMYEEILAFKEAAERLQLPKASINRFFYGNAAHIIKEANDHLSKYL